MKIPDCILRWCGYKKIPLNTKLIKETIIVHWILSSCMDRVKNGDEVDFKFETDCIKATINDDIITFRLPTSINHDTLFLMIATLINLTYQEIEQWVRDIEIEINRCKVLVHKEIWEYEC